MKKLLSVFTAVAIGFASVACSSTSNAVALVDGKAITKSEFEEQLKFNKWALEQQYGDAVWDQLEKQNPDFETAMKSNMLEQMVQSKIILNYAEKNDIKPNAEQLKKFNENLDKVLKDKTKKETFEKSGLTSEALKKYGEQAAILTGFNEYVTKKSEPTEKELKEYYEKNKEKVDASHILLSTTDEKGQPMTEEKKAEVKKQADELYNKLKNGADFAKLAKEKSADPGSAQNGGNLGEFGKGKMVKEFDEAVFSLKEGEISKPVLTQFGYHIIKLNKKVTKTYAEMKDELKQELSQTKSSELIKKIQESSKIEKYEDKLKDIKFIEKKTDSKDTKSNDSEKKDEKSTDNKKSDEKSTDEKSDNSKSKDTKTETDTESSSTK